MKTCMKDRLVKIIGNLDVGQRIRKKHIFSTIKKLKPNGKTILDAGSGLGDYIFSLAQKYPQNQFIGIEIDSEKVNQCILKQHRLDPRNIEFIQGDLEESLPLNGFDIIYSVDVLEHIADDMKVLTNFYEALKPGGILLLHIPNINQKRYLEKFKNWKQIDHVRNGYGKEKIVDKLSRIGFSNIKTEFTCGWAGALAWEIQSILKTAFKHRLAQIISFPFTAVLTFIDVHLNKTTGNGILLMARK